MGEHRDPVLTSAGYLLLKAGVQMHAAMDAVLAELELTGRDFLVLSFVGSGGGLSQQQLSRRLGLDPTIVVGLVDGLEERSLVRRDRDPTDRRRYILSLTAAGKRLHRRAQKAAAGAEDEFLGPLSGPDRDVLRRLLLDVMTPRLHWLGPTDDTP